MIQPEKKRDLGDLFWRIEPLKEVWISSQGNEVLWVYWYLAREPSPDEYSPVL